MTRLTPDMKKIQQNLLRRQGILEELIQSFQRWSQEGLEAGSERHDAHIRGISRLVENYGSLVREHAVMQGVDGRSPAEAGGGAGACRTLEAHVRGLLVRVVTLYDQQMRLFGSRRESLGREINRVQGERTWVERVRMTGSRPEHVDLCG